MCVFLFCLSVGFINMMCVFENMKHDEGENVTLSPLNIGKAGILFHKPLTKTKAYCTQ